MKTLKAILAGINRPYEETEPVDMNDEDEDPADEATDEESAPVFEETEPADEESAEDVE